ncbi:MAG: 50S ribosomal protein L28 [Bacteroidales bacterium]|nr:50S ribosomal protein L28 [Bacteroidales bacterium]
MSKVCEITGKKVITGNHVSHSHHKTRRKFQVNLHTKKFFIPEEDKFVTLKVSAKGMRIIDKVGISNALKSAKDKGFYKA